MARTEQEEQIYQALDAMMQACGFRITEALFVAIDDAVRSVVKRWGEVAQSHEDGRGHDVNAMLAREIAKAASHWHMESEAAEEEHLENLLKCKTMTNGRSTN